MSALDVTAPFTAAELVAAAEGREGTMLRICREAAAQIEEKIRARIAADSTALGLELKVEGGDLRFHQPKPARINKTRPEAPPDDAGLLLMLLAELERGRATVRGLAGKFRGTDIDRVRRVLADEASRGAPARVKLEPNGRTWTRTGER